MQQQLINGRFTKNEAVHILTALYSAKIEFHEKKIRSTEMNEEDIKHSEKKIKQLQLTLAELKTKIHSNQKEVFDIHATVDVEL
ncbi:MAG: hypothetical protein IBJ16_00315 [Chitinophagaceae bacterium]|nr:hypothetical protein [Chitinophagaceae bacterium]